MCISLQEERQIIVNHIAEIVENLDVVSLDDIYFSIPDEKRQEWYDELPQDDPDGGDEDYDEDAEEGDETEDAEAIETDWPVYEPQRVY